MYYISEFCRICMQYDKNLIDIVKIEREPHETLLTKLKLCVSEVVSATFKTNAAGTKQQLFFVFSGMDVQQHTIVPIMHKETEQLL